MIAGLLYLLQQCMHMHIYYITSPSRPWYPHVAIICNFVRIVTFVKTGNTTVYWCRLQLSLSYVHVYLLPSLCITVWRISKRNIWYPKASADPSWPIFRALILSHHFFFHQLLPSITRLISFICSDRNIIWEGWGSHTCINVSTTIIRLQFQTVTVTISNNYNIRYR